MALWTPYADDVALDLSKTEVKKEPEPKVPPSIESAAPAVYGYGYHSYPTVPAGHPAYYSGYYYTRDYLVPPTHPSPVSGHDFVVPQTQISPISGGSTCSSYEASVPPVSVSPQYGNYPARPPSPPESPLANSKRLCMDVDALSDDPDFQAFERDALRAMAEKNGGSLLGNNPRMRRAVRSTNQDSANDAYRKQRERNNYAAKQSRDRRKMREIHLALKVSFLKNEVANLKAKLASKACSRCQALCLC
ncbi:thyrotroph embryonic factor-like [Ostrinia furnacalis]|uniref:thyrotroph embryonic factor-like n=1 Tax=Ostrinia furnacalis TaxID=93504 RepID=UPI00103F0EEA|nr:thyrotroph embryonic factor-like [Ostrinia furnacalis]